MGGLTSLQREVLSILSSPLTPSTLRAKGLGILSGLRKAHAEDKSRSAEERAKDEREAEVLEREAKEEEERSKEEGEGEAAIEGGEGGAKKGVRGHGVVEEKGMRAEGVVRKHAVFIGERKHYEVRLVAPNLAIYDANGKFFL